jgi:hypothetical protein
MRRDRTRVRIVKVLILLGTIGLFIEGMFEWKLLGSFLFAPPSVPGQTKILEHFVLQHILFVCIGLLLVFRPASLVSTVASWLARAYLGVTCVVVTVPEIIVSVKGDLFRPYPFSLHFGFLRQVESAKFGGVCLNLLQVQHLLFAHFALMGTILAISAAPHLLRAFAGPWTGEKALVNSLCSAVQLFHRY